MTIIQSPKMKRVYRIESINQAAKKNPNVNCGMYSVYGADKSYGGSIGNLISYSGLPSMETHPTPNYDKKLIPLVSDMPWEKCEEYFFGFTSLHQARKWCRRPENFREADKVAQISMYLVPEKDVLVGTHQVMFIPTKDIVLRNSRPVSALIKKG